MNSDIVWENPFWMEVKENAVKALGLSGGEYLNYLWACVANFGETLFESH